MKKGIREKAVMLLVPFCLLLLLMACGGETIGASQRSVSAAPARITGEEYDVAIEALLDVLDEKGYAAERYEFLEYEIIDVRLSDDRSVDLYAFTAEELGHFNIEPNELPGAGEADKFITIPDGEGAWYLPLYTNAGGTCHIAVLAGTEEHNEIQEVIDWFVG